MHTAKELVKYTKKLSVLYVEDDEALRKGTLSLFKVFFDDIDTACDGVDGLEKYNDKMYDLIITDINMPRMNGIDMVTKIKEINTEQKVVAISAHNESKILIDLIQAGVTSFLLKPMVQEEVINILYSICRDAYNQILNIELVHELNEKNEELQKKIKALESRNNTIDIKHSQIENLLQQKKRLNPLNK